MTATSGIPATPAVAVPAGSAPAPVEFRAADGVRIAAADWETRATGVRQSLLEDGLPESSMTEALTSFRFLDDGGRTWSYNGAGWWVWDGQRWAAEPAPESLALQPFTLEPLSEVGDKPPAGVAPLDDAAEPLPTADEIGAAAAAATPEPVLIPNADGSARPTAGPVAASTITPPQVATAAPPVAVAAPSPPALAPPSPVVAPAPAGAPYRPTHFVPAGGLPAWSKPDPGLPAENRLDAGLDVMVAETFANGWARIVCSNGWGAWVDGRSLVPVGEGLGGAGVAGGAAPVVPSPAIASGWVATPAPAGKRPTVGFRSEIGSVALLAILTWGVAAFIAPYGVLIAIVEHPWIAGGAIALILLTVKVIRGGAPTPRDAAMFLLDTAIAAIMFTLLSPG